MTTQCLVSETLQADLNQLGVFLWNGDMWVFLTYEDYSNAPESINLIQININDMTTKIPNLHPYLSKRSGTFRYTNRGISEIGKDEYEASNPGGITVNPVTWLSYKPFYPLLYTALLITSIIMNHNNAIIAASSSFVIYWSFVFLRNKKGCANPGIIVSENPLLIAVFTDLTKGEDEYPVVKVCKIKQNKKTPVKLNQSVATVALYNGGDDEKYPYHHKDFEPTPIYYATGNPDKEKLVLDSFSQAEWKYLETWISKQTKFKKGLYFIKQN